MKIKGKGHIGKQQIAVEKYLAPESSHKIASTSRNSPGKASKNSTEDRQANQESNRSSITQVLVTTNIQNSRAFRDEFCLSDKYSVTWQASYAMEEP